MTEPGFDTDRCLKCKGKFLEGEKHYHSDCLEDEVKGLREDVNRITALLEVMAKNDERLANCIESLQVSVVKTQESVLKFARSTNAAARAGGH